MLDDVEEGSNGGLHGMDCVQCRFDILQMKAMMHTNTQALSHLTEVLDDRVSQLIVLLDKRLDAPWIAMSRMLLIVCVVVLAFIGSIFVGQHGITATETLVESIRK